MEEVKFYQVVPETAITLRIKGMTTKSRLSALHIKAGDVVEISVKVVERSKKNKN